jgi:Putative polyhydroxyalkanoic acid system protein (PHA_gran_rgn)
MPDLVVAVSHLLSQDEALRRVQMTVDQAKAQYSDNIGELRETWNGYVGDFFLSAVSQQTSATVTVNPSEVTVQMKLPWFALGFEPVIEAKIRDVLNKILA